MDWCLSAGLQSVVLVVSLVDWPLVLLDDLVVDYGSGLYLLHLRDSDGLLLSHLLDDLRDHSLNPPCFWQIG